MTGNGQHRATRYGCLVWLLAIVMLCWPFALGLGRAGWIVFGAWVGVLALLGLIRFGMAVSRIKPRPTRPGPPA